MDKQALIQGLKSLIEDRQCFVDEKDPECVFKEDIECLEEAIRIIEEAPEVPVREQEVLIIPKITFNYGVLKTSRFYITTDKSFYEDMIKNSKVIPVFTPELMSNPNSKETHQHVLDLPFYALRIPEDK